MGDDDLRVFLERGHDRDDGDVFGDGGEGLQHVAAHVELHPVGHQKRAVVDLRAAGDDLDLETAGGIGAVSDGLVETAVFGLRQPVGAEHHLLLGGGGHGDGGQRQRGDGAGDGLPCQFH